MTVTVVGGGLAGCEAAWALAERGIDVTIHEMRPVVRTAAHQTDRLGELVCSNSFKSVELQNAHGLLKAELRDLGSVLLPLADEARVPGGAALAVDRDVFSTLVHARINSHPRITVVRGEAVAIPDVGVIATGPLTSTTLAEAIKARLGSNALAFFDAIAPIVSTDSLDHDVLYAKSRWGKGDGDDYLNAPFTHAEYEAFIDALTAADQFHAHEFDDIAYFEGCLPVEEMAKRGRETPRFGPMKPIGLHDPRTGREPYAAVQLRREDKAGQMWNLVGLPDPAPHSGTAAGLPNDPRARQRRVPALREHPPQQLHQRAGIARTGADDEGRCAGLLCRPAHRCRGLHRVDRHRAARRDQPGAGDCGPMLRWCRRPPPCWVGCIAISREADPAHFQPMNANFGLLDPIEGVKKADRKQALVDRARADFAAGCTACSRRPARRRRSKCSASSPCMTASSHPGRW